MPIANFVDFQQDLTLHYLVFLENELLPFVVGKAFMNLLEELGKYDLELIELRTLEIYFWKILSRLLLWFCLNKCKARSSGNHQRFHTAV